MFLVVVHTKSRKANLISALFVIFLLVLFVITSIEQDKKWQKYYDKIVEIRHTDSVALKVTNLLQNGSALFFNDSLCILSYKMNQTDLIFRDIHKLELPFYFKKAADNDTIWITDNKNETYFWVFRKDRDFVKFNVELPDTIYREQENIPIILRLENIRPETLSINNPAHWWNTYPQIKQGKKKVSLRKANYLPANEVYDTIHIYGNETLRIKYDIALDELFDFENYPSGEYNIEFQFFYERRYNKYFEDITLLKVLFSNRAIQEKSVQYDEEESIMSNKFTFYLE